MFVPADFQFHALLLLLLHTADIKTFLKFVTLNKSIIDNYLTNNKDEGLYCYVKILIAHC